MGSGTLRCLSVNIDQHPIHRCNLLTYVNRIHKCCCPFWGKAHIVLWTKEKRNPVVINLQFKSLHLWWYKDALVSMELATYTSGKALSVLKGIYRFKKATYAPGQITSFSGTLHTIFQQDNAKPYTVSITTAWLCSRDVRVLDWLAEVKTFNQLKTFGTSVKTERMINLLFLSALLHNIFFCVLLIFPTE